MIPFSLIYAWKNNPIRAGFYGRPCRIVCTGRMGSALVEFKNGEQTVTSRRAVRRAKEVTP